MECISMKKRSLFFPSESACSRMNSLHQTCPHYQSVMTVAWCSIPACINNDTLKQMCLFIKKLPPSDHLHYQDSGFKVHKPVFYYCNYSSEAQRNKKRTKKANVSNRCLLLQSSRNIIIQQTRVFSKMFSYITCFNVLTKCSKCSKTQLLVDFL